MIFDILIYNPIFLNHFFWVLSIYEFREKNLFPFLLRFMHTYICCFNTSQKNWDYIIKKRPICAHKCASFYFVFYFFDYLDPLWCTRCGWILAASPPLPTLLFIKNVFDGGVMDFIGVNGIAIIFHGLIAVNDFYGDFTFFFVFHKVHSVGSVIDFNGGTVFW